MKATTVTALLAILRPTVAHIESFYLPGYGFAWYDPSCAFACYNALSGAPLECTSMDHSGGHSHGAGPTSPECRASDEPFLTTLAYCMKEHCNDAGVSVWRRERFWNDHVTGDESVSPRWDYSEALALIQQPPIVVFNSSEVLNTTALLPEASYAMQNNFNVMFDYLESLQSKYIFVILSVSAGIPVLCTLLRYTPFLDRVVDLVKPYLWQSIVGSYHTRPLPYLMGNAPNVGQAVWIAIFIILNVVLTSVNYHSSQPHAWYFSPKSEMLAYIGYRTGHISYALLPLTILLSSRNNFLLWITNWSHNTYMLLHRWVARMFTLHAIIHSITLLLCYQGTGSYPVESQKPYWLWGIVATVLACAMLVLSHLYFRRLSYEIFLALHIIMAVLVIVGCWYHVILKWGFNFYDVWLMAASAFWVFDRLLRVILLVKNGIRRSVVTEVDAEHVRIDIPGVRFASKPGYVAFIYLPSFSRWTLWENHPFSVNSTSLFSRNQSSPRPSLLPNHSTQSSTVQDLEKNAISTAVASKSQEGDLSSVSAGSSHTGHRTVHPGTDGITLFVKRNSGLTRRIQACSGVTALVEGPYRHHTASEILTCDRVLLLGGGIGVTGLLPWVHAHPNVKMAWSVRAGSGALVDAVAPAFASLTADNLDVKTGQRIDIDACLQLEVESQWKRVGVVVCGPAAMCDAVRENVSRVAKANAGRINFELEVEAFSW